MLLSCGLQVDSVCAFFHLIRLYADTIAFDTDSATTKKLKVDAQQLFGNKVEPMLFQLLSSFDPAIMNAATGNNALHELLSRIVPSSTGMWPNELAEALIQHGVSIHQRNKQGRTVALVLVDAMSSLDPSACTLQLLLQHGADINAQDSNGGDTLLHHLIRNEALRVLRGLLESEASGLDFFVLNSAGHTPADLAAIKHAEDPDNDDCRQIHRIIRVQVQTWRSRVRPVVLSALSMPLIPDVAKLVLGYVDGSGLAFPSAEAKVEPPAAAAAAAASSN